VPYLPVGGDLLSPALRELVSRKHDKDVRSLWVTVDCSATARFPKLPKISNIFTKIDSLFYFVRSEPEADSSES
jgi:hypothetical protein